MLLALYTLIVVMLLFGLTIFIHELGHFLVARYYGMKIDAFAIGFGPAIWSKKKDGVLYKVGIIPFGGYVALPQMDPQIEENYESEDGQPLPDVAPWKKIPVALAGAVGNIILAFLVAWIIFFIGKPSQPSERNTIVGFVMEESEEFRQGIRPGDRIITVNGSTVGNWQDILVEAALSETVHLTVEREDGTVFEATIDTTDDHMGLRSVWGIAGISYAEVLQLIPDSPAERAGLQAGDRVLEINEQPIFSPTHLSKIVSELGGQTVPITVRRDGEHLTFPVTPEHDDEMDRAMIGIRFNPWAVDYDAVIHPRPTELIREFSTLIFRVLGALVTPSTSGMAASALAGPVFILKSLWDMVQNSFAMALWFTCLLNVNLAILNLMPIPVLDGGHIVFSLYEVITRRRINAKFKTALMTACWFLLIFAMLYLSFRDVTRLGWVGRSSSAPVAEEVVDDEADPEDEPEPGQD